MRQMIIYAFLGVLLLAVIGGWQIFTDTGQGELLLQKYIDINDLPSDYRQLVEKAAKSLPEIPQDAEFEFMGTPDEILPDSPSGDPVLAELKSTRNVRWIGKFRAAKSGAPARSFTYVIENGRVSKILPASE